MPVNKLRVLQDDDHFCRLRYTFGARGLQDAATYVLENVVMERVRFLMLFAIIYATSAPHRQQQRLTFCNQFAAADTATDGFAFLMVRTRCDMENRLACIRFCDAAQHHSPQLLPFLVVAYRSNVHVAE